jgi:hypothetical protein
MIKITTIEILPSIDVEPFSAVPEHTEDVEKYKRDGVLTRTFTKENDGLKRISVSLWTSAEALAEYEQLPSTIKVQSDRIEYNKDHGIQRTVTREIIPD